MAFFFWWWGFHGGFWRLAFGGRFSVFGAGILALRGYFMTGLRWQVFGDGFGGGRQTFGGGRRGFNSVLLTAAFRR